MAQRGIFQRIQELYDGMLEGIGIKKGIYDWLKLNDILDDIVVMADPRNLTQCQYWVGIGVEMPHSDMDNAGQVETTLLAIKQFLNNALYNGNQLLRMQIVLTTSNNYAREIERHARVVLSGENPIFRCLSEERLARLRQEMESEQLRRYSMYLLVQTMPEYVPPKKRFPVQKDLSKFYLAEHERFVIEAERVRSTTIELLKRTTGFQCSRMRNIDYLVMFYEFLNPSTSRLVPLAEPPEEHRLADLKPEVWQAYPGLKPTDMAEAVLIDKNFITSPSGIFYNDGYYQQVIVLSRFPSSFGNDCLAPIYQSNANLCLVIDIQALERGEQLASLRRLSNLSSSNQVKFTGRVNQAAIETMKQADADIAAMEEGSNMFQVSIGLVVRDTDIKRLQSLVTKLRVELANLGDGAVATPVNVGAVQEYLKLSPCSYDPPTRNYFLLDSETAHFFPVSGPFRGVGKLPRLLLHNPSGGLTSLDTDCFVSNHFIIAAPTGSGKTFLMKMLLSQTLSIKNPRKLVIIDAGGSYNSWMDLIGGKVVNFANLISSGNASINYFAMPGHISTDELIAIQNGTLLKVKHKEGDKSALEVLNEQVTMITLMSAEVRKNGQGKIEIENKVDKELAAVLSACLIWSHVRARSEGREHLLGDVVRVLAAQEKDIEDIPKLIENEKLAERCGSIARCCSKFVRGVYQNFFNRPTRLDIDAHAVVFDVANLETLGIELLPISVFMILEFVWGDTTRNPNGIRVVADEVWSFLSNEVTGDVIVQLLRRGRSKGVIVGLISQSVEDFTEYGRVIFQNTAWKYLLKPRKLDAVIDLVEVEGNKLSEGQINAIRTLENEQGAYSDIFVIAEKTTGTVRVKPTPLETAINTTDPNDKKVLNFLTSKLQTTRQATPGDVFAAACVFAEFFPQGVSFQSKVKEILPEELIEQAKASLTEQQLEEARKIKHKLNEQMRNYFLQQDRQVPTYILEALLDDYEESSPTVVAGELALSN